MTNRETELMTMGKAIKCKACRKTSYLYPKAVGTQPYIWEINCSACHRFDLGLNAYVPDHKDAIDQLEQLRNHYIEGATSRDIQPQIDALAAKYDPVIENNTCSCGKKLSIAARPRCLHCDMEIFDSYFHYIDDAPK